MKDILLFFLVLLFPFQNIIAQSISIHSTPDKVITENGNEIKFTLKLKVENFNNQQVLLRIKDSDFNSIDVNYLFMPSVISAPYTDTSILSLTFNNLVDTGEYVIVIEAGNGIAVSMDTLSIQIVNELCYFSTVETDKYQKIGALAIANDSVIWMNTSKGVVLFNKNQWFSDNEINSLITGGVRPITINGDTILIPTEENGLLMKLADTTITFNTNNSFIPSNNITSVTPGDSTTIWIATKDAGLAKFDGINWTIFNQNNSNLKSNYVRKIISDHLHNIWFINFGSGEYLGRILNDTVKIFTSENSCITDKHINVLAVDSLNFLWVGTEKGVIKYNGINWEHWYEKSTTPFNHVILNSECGVILNDNTSELSWPFCNYIFIDQHGNKWISVRGFFTTPPAELFKFDGVNWKNYNPVNSDIPGNTVFSMAQETNGDIWMTTMNNSLGGTENLTKYYCEDAVNIINDIRKQNDQTNIFINVYPNPNKGDFTISLPANVGHNLKLNILNTIGQIVYTKNSFKMGGRINLHFLQPSIYFIEIVDRDFGQRYYRPVSIQ